MTIYLMQNTEVVSLPMRDGNIGKESGLHPGRPVVSLPMRDGNIAQTCILNSIPGLLAYL